MSFARLFRGALLAALGGTILLMERKRRAREYVEPPARHMTRNLVIAGLAAATVQALEAPAVLPLARMIDRRQCGLTGPMRSRPWLRDLAAILLLDYTLYIWHRIAHRVPWLWRFHLVHHVDLDLDASTGLRFHAGELAASVPWRAAQILAIGVTTRALVLWQGLTIASVLFHHSNIRLSDRLEDIVSWIIATPRMHAIHHSIHPAQLQSNFSSGLAIWDRLHGTARFDARAEEIRVGVPGYLDREDVTLGRILVMPFSNGSALPRGAADAAKSLE
ncbi:MAG: sterol desaturase family protein [Vicinamibacterales bacterium]